MTSRILYRVVVLLALLTVVGPAGATSIFKEPFKHASIPKFSAPVLDTEKRLFNSSERGGEVWIVCVWASWADQAPLQWKELMTIPAAYRSKIVGLNHHEDCALDALAFLKKYGNPFSLSLRDSTGDVTRALYIIGIPEFLIIDKSGYVAYRHFGWLRNKDWKEKFEPVLRVLESEPANNPVERTGSQLRWPPAAHLAR